MLTHDSSPMITSMPISYRVVRWVLQAAMGFYFARIERFHKERVPSAGPVLFTSNHPNSITDAFVIGAAVPRKVNFVATVQLFQWAPLRWLLNSFGVIPVNRVKDNPRAMRTVFETFEDCFRALEKGEAVGIFPEGVTHDDPQLKTVKTGAARIALELEHRHGGRLGLQIVPVGLTFSAKERYGSDVLVNFGEPIRVADHLAGYPKQKRECIQRLTTDIEHSIEALILHLPKLERARLVEAVKRLYLDRLLVGNRIIREPVPAQVCELMLTQAVAHAVDFICDRYPERAANFTRKLDMYEQRLRRLHLSDEDLAHFPNKTRLLWRSLGWAWLGVVLFPVAAFGWLHCWLPIRAVNLATRRFAKSPANKTHIATASILAGLVSYGTFYGACIAICHAIFGWPTSLLYGLSLPVASVGAHHYFSRARQFIAGLRCARVLFRAPFAARRLRALRNELIAQIESARWEVPIAVLNPERRGAQ